MFNAWSIKEFNPYYKSEVQQWITDFSHLAFEKKKEPALKPTPFNHEKLYYKFKSKF